jgi:hypothetical protein
MLILHLTRSLVSQRQRHMDGVLCLGQFHGESAAREDGEHRLVLRKRLGFELAHAFLPGDTGEMFQDASGDS